MRSSGGGTTIEPLSGLHLRLVAADEMRRETDRRAAVRAILWRYEDGRMGAEDVRSMLDCLGLLDSAAALASPVDGPPG